MSGPLVTLGVPLYRGQDQVPATLECLRTQTYQNLDVLISVDADDQASAAACESYLRRDSRFRMHVQTSRLGWAGNTNWTMRERRGEFYISFNSTTIRCRRPMSRTWSKLQCAIPTPQSVTPRCNTRVS